jgi:hypothetical protein
VCHQSVGLIARDLESAGIATLCLTSAYSITAAVNPPRAAFVDFPLGHTAGKPKDDQANKQLVKMALKAFETITHPGEIVNLGLSWNTSQSWKQHLKSSSASDDRTERAGSPQYQTVEDEQSAVMPCTSCVWLT